MTYETLLVEKKDGIALVTFNRPDKLNTLNTQLCLDLKNLMAEFRYDLETRVVIFTGSGRAFCAGVDLRIEALKQHLSQKEMPNERIWQLFFLDLMTDIENLEQITIAAINGPAMGGGLCIATNCDFRVAADTARMGVPETGLGVYLSWGATPRLTALLGPARAKEFIMTADPLGAEEALNIGMVNRVVPADQLIPASYELANKIMRRGPLAIRICKKQINAASVARMSDLHLFESELWERNQLSPDLQEGIMASIEKRPPAFKTESGVPKFDLPA
ncbi:MAG: enoyl-CoA hydratase/isomerase family protein [Dehalococcoidia bacterium]|nr:enoyl-CoA hydratase/isomerase family protein [Dehalococcoidia bacterium]